MHLLENVLVGQMAVPDLVAPAALGQVLIRRELEAVGAPATFAPALGQEDGEDVSRHQLPVVEGLSTGLGHGDLTLGWVFLRV